MSTMQAMVGSSPAKDAAKPREENDWYRTPESATLALLRVERFSHVIEEPACGDGAIARVLEAAGHTVFPTDLIDRGYGIAGRDFLLQRGRICDSIIINPPFKFSDEFTLHALELGYEHIAIFARLAWLEGAARHKRLWSQHPPSRIWTFCKRQTLWRGDEETPGKGGTLAFAWFVWSKGHAGTQMGWLA